MKYSGLFLFLLLTSRILSCIIELQDNLKGENKMNQELCKFYLGMEPNYTTIPEVPYTDVISALEQCFSGKWTWELADERLVDNGNTVCTTVTLYTPGRVYTGRSLCKVADYHASHLFAILDACKTYIFKKGSSNVNAQSQNVTQSQPQSTQMTPDQIMSAIGQQNTAQPVINTAAEFYNHKDKNGIPMQGVPFDSITQNCMQELQNEGNAPAQPQQSQSNDYDAPLDKYKGFSQRQIDRLNQFKKDFDILNDEMFGNYVNTWDKTLTSKSQITPANANAFLDWVESLGKMDC